MLNEANPYFQFELARRKNDYQTMADILNEHCFAAPFKDLARLIQQHIEYQHGQRKKKPKGHGANKVVNAMNNLKSMYGDNSYRL